MNHPIEGCRPVFLASDTVGFTVDGQEGIRLSDALEETAWGRDDGSC